MGKASRIKKERKLSASQKKCVRKPTARQNSFLGDSRISEDSERMLVIVDGSGRVFKGAQARDRFYADVVESMRGDDPSALPAMVELGRMCGLSILDAEVPIYERGGAQEEARESLLMALFCLDYTRCFEWALKHAFQNWSEKSAALCIGKLLAELCESGYALKEGSLRMGMAKMASRELIDFFHKNGGLEQLENSPLPIKQWPVFKTILADFKAEIASAEERVELESAIAVNVDSQARGAADRVIAERLVPPAIGERCGGRMRI